MKSSTARKAPRSTSSMMQSACDLLVSASLFRVVQSNTELMTTAKSSVRMARCMYQPNLSHFCSKSAKRKPFMKLSRMNSTVSGDASDRASTSITLEAPRPDESIPSSEIWYCVTGPHTHNVFVCSFFIMCWNMTRRPRLAVSCSGFMPSISSLTSRPRVPTVSSVLSARTAAGSSLVRKSYMPRRPFIATACRGK